MRRALFLCTALAAALADAGSARADPGTLAILSVPGAGLWGPDLERVDQAVRAGIAEVKGTAVQPAATTAEHFAEARKMGLACDLKDVECAVKVGVLADAARVLLVAPSLDDGVYAVSLLLADVGQATVLGRLTWHAPARGDDLERGMRRATSALLEPARHKGLLYVDVDRLGAEISVDGAARGAAPLPDAIGELAPGPHELVVRHPSAVVERKTVVVTADGPTIVSVQLRGKPLADDEDLPGDRALAPSTSSAPALPQRGPGALVLAGGALAGLGVLAAAGAGAGAGLIEAQLNAPMDDARRDAVLPWGQGLLVAAAGGLVVGAVGGGLLAVGLMDDGP